MAKTTIHPFESSSKTDNAIFPCSHSSPGRPLFAELSPVTDFREACCRQHETLDCTRGGFCNFMHLRYATPALVRELQHELSVELSDREREKRRREKELAASKNSGKGKKSWRDREVSNGEVKEEEGEETNVGGGGGWRKGESGGDWRSSRKEKEKSERRRSASPGGQGRGQSVEGRLVMVIQNLEFDSPRLNLA